MKGRRKSRSKRRGGPQEATRLFGRVRHPKKRAFLAALSETANVSEAAQLAGIDRSTVYTKQWWQDATFRACFDEAIDMAGDRLEREALRRAVEGVKEPVGWYKGEPGGVVTRYSDTLLIFLLKGARPDKYRERYDHHVEAEVTHNIEQTRESVRNRLAKVGSTNGAKGNNR